MIAKTKLFVSSTWLDLQPEREAVEKALRMMADTEFVGMEYFGSRPETPRATSLAEVDLSDVYIGIFARRYGSGITEDEYRRAQHRGIPCLIYLKDETVDVPPAFVETDAEGISKLNALVRDLKDSHLFSTFRTPEELATKVVAHVHNLMRRLQSIRHDEIPGGESKYRISMGNVQKAFIGDHMAITQQFGPDGQPTDQHELRDRLGHERGATASSTSPSADEPSALCSGGGTVGPAAERSRVVRGLIKEAEGLSEDDRKALEESMIEIAKDTPAAVPAAQKLKNLVGKLAPKARALVWEWSIEVASATAAKVLKQ